MSLLSYCLCLERYDLLSYLLVFVLVSFLQGVRDYSEVNYSKHARGSTGRKPLVSWRRVSAPELRDSVK